MKYEVRTSKDNLKNIKSINLKNLKVLDNEIVLNTNDKGLERLSKNIENIVASNKRKEFLKKIIKKYLISIIALIILIVFLINQSFIIKKIEFKNVNTYDENVLTFIDEHIYKLGPFSYLKTDITEINKELKKEYFYYEWISLERKGTVLYVNIKKQSERSFIDNESTLVGDIISNSDGVIKKYFILKGISLIKDMQVVKKGELLVSGNLSYKTGDSTSTNYIHPLAIVIARVNEYKTYDIEKEQVSLEKTGKVEIKYSYTLFEKEYQENSNFENYEVKHIVMNDYRIFKRIKSIYYELKEQKTIYTLTDAIEYGQSMVRREFKKNKIHGDEKIISIEVVKTINNTDSYNIKFIVKMMKNIAEFRSVKLEE